MEVPVICTIAHEYKHSTIQTKQLNDFKRKVFEEFEANCSHVLGVSSYRVREVRGHHGENIDDKFDAAWQFGGAAHMRQTISITIATLVAVYYESKIKRIKQR